MATNEMIARTAKDVWEYLTMHAEENGAPEAENKFGRGWTFETIPVGAWIRDIGTSKELEKRYVVDLVRNYLKATGNVVPLQRVSVPGEKPSFRIFVRKDWNAGQVVRSGVGNQWIAYNEKKISVKDAGEDREPSPVTTRKLWDEFRATPLSDQQVEILSKLYHDYNGKLKVNTKSRQSVEKALGIQIDHQGSAASSIRALKDRGLVVAKKAHKRQTDTIELTSTGVWAAQNAEYLGTAETAILAYLKAHKGKFVGSTVSKTMGELGERVHKSPKSVRYALKDLEDRGVVKLSYPNGTKYAGAITLIDYEEPERLIEDNNDALGHNDLTEREIQRIETVEQDLDDLEAKLGEFPSVKAEAFALIARAVTLLSEDATPKSTVNTFKSKVTAIINSGHNPYLVVGEIMDLLEQEDD